jgi:hypothetical protein
MSQGCPAAALQRRHDCVPVSCVVNSRTWKNHSLRLLHNSIGYFCRSEIDSFNHKTKRIIRLRRRKERELDFTFKFDCGVEKKGAFVSKNAWC